MHLNVKRLVDEKFDNKNQFSKALGVSYEASCKIYNGETTKISFDTLETLCDILDCTPNDVFESDIK